MVNNIVLQGVLADDICAVNAGDAGMEWNGTVSVVRKSGTADYIPVVLPEREMPGMKIADLLGKRVIAIGEIRTYTDNTAETGKRHRVVVWVTSISEQQHITDDQHLVLSGRICKKPVYRLTPNGREICELLIANNTIGGANYIPVICWGQTARRMAEAHVSDVVAVNGRFQSRQYEKKLDAIKGPDGGAASVWRTAYEVSAISCQVTVRGGKRE